MKVALANLGCKANQYDGTYMSALLAKNNFQLVDFKAPAEIYIINTCTVTDAADADSRNLIRRAHRRNPEATIVVTGCYAQTKTKEVAQIEGVNLVLGNNQKAGLLDYLARARREQEKIHIQVDDIFKQTQLETFGFSSFTQNTRAYVKIQDGCNQFCSFCIIPFARGRNRSISMDQVLDELQDLSEQGYYEAILTGIHIGTYGHDLNPKTNLVKLLKAIEKNKPIHRVRISSIDPEEISEEMIELLADSKVLCPHLHIPIQSGDDTTLKLMRRRYTRSDFIKLSERLNKKIPNISLGTDVMVGFPYEDEARFQNTYELLKSSPLSYFHVFPFSAKRSTKAAKMLGQVSTIQKKDRASRLRQLSQTKASEYRKKFLEKEVEIILEKKISNQVSKNSNEALHNITGWRGFSENYLPVVLKVQQGRSGQLQRCRLKKEEGGCLAGEIN